MKPFRITFGSVAALSFAVLTAVGAPACGDDSTAGPPGGGGAADGSGGGTGADGGPGTGPQNGNDGAAGNNGDGATPSGDSGIVGGGDAGPPVSFDGGTVKGPDGGPVQVSVTWYGGCWYNGTINGTTGNYQSVDFEMQVSSPIAVEGSLFFAPNCDPSNGIDNMNDYGTTTPSTHMIQGFVHHPDVIPSSALYWLGDRTADGLCPPGGPCSGCYNYNATTPSCDSLP